MDESLRQRYTGSLRITLAIVVIGCCAIAVGADERWHEWWPVQVALAFVIGLLWPDHFRSRR